MKYLLTCLAVLMLLGCGTEYPLLDADLPDAGPPAQVLPGAPACRPELVGVSIYHCGACDDHCPPADTDRCTDGLCRCGNEHPCRPGMDCRGGRCVATDPEGLPCEFDDWCAPTEACIEGRCSFVECVPEICNGLDDDCDGVVDNTGDMPLAQWCLGDEEAPDEPLLPCMRGVRVCSDGQWTECIGDVPPVEEVGLLGCDGSDNDCDGCVDGVAIDGYCESREPTSFDVLFLIDTSGSMSNKIDIVRQAVRLFSTRLSTSPTFRWGIVHIPDISTSSVPGLYQDLTNFSTFNASLLASWGTGGSEPQWDAVHHSLDGTLSVSWRPDSTKILILFTDEPGGGIGHSIDIMSESEMCVPVIEQGAVLISVTNPIEDYDECAYQTIPLPSGDEGSLDMCGSDSDCIEEESCAAAQCVTTTVTDLAGELDVVIADPCGG